jgi:phytoene desaturase (3,4-didehydrolycopene-forming)
LKLPHTLTSVAQGELKAQLEAIEPGAGGMFFDWLGRARSSLDLGVKAFIERDSTSALDFLNPGLVLPLALKVNALDLLLSQHRQMSGYFKSEKLRSLFSFQELYVGLSPYNAPGVFSLLAATELTDGVWYPKGGFGTVRDALQSIGQKLGVKLRTSTAVTQLITQEDAPPASVDGDTAAVPKRRVVGVRLDSGEVLPADVVVANPDLPWVFQHLLSESGPAYEAEAKRVDAMDYSASVIAYNFAMKKPLRKLLHHNVFLSSDYRGSWERPTCPQDLAAPRQLNFYVHNPCVTDPSSAPEGSASVMVLLPVANLQEQQAAATAAGRPMPDVDAMIAAGRDAIFRRWIADGVADADVATNVEHEFVITPQEWGTRYNITHGAVFGLAHGLTQLACFRPPTRTGLPGWPETPSTQGLYFVGASTRPGNGVPLVMMGVKVVFENIMREAGRVAV